MASAAVRSGGFHVYAVDTIDEGLEILTGMEAGVPGPGGAFPEGSVNGRVAAKLKRFAEGLRAFGGGGEL